MNLLIVTRTGDVHAKVVATSAALQGHTVMLWSAPEEAGGAVKTSVKVDSRMASWQVGETSRNENSFDVIWLRRTWTPRVGAGVHPDDRWFVASENSEFFGMLWASVGPRSTWVHDYGARQYGENKIVQLCAARKVGLSIPDTLFSQDQESIVRFVAEIEQQGGQAIYKTFAPASWQGDVSTRVKETTCVSSSVLSAKKSLSLVPGIYQRRIDKDFELRVNLFGENAITVAINSQADERSSLDWRGLPNFNGFVRPFVLPEDMRLKCVALLHEIGLTMGCIDIVVDKDGAYQFLEVNQQGQFLWIEEVCPEVKLLDAFVRFLCERAGHAGMASAIQYTDVANSELYHRISREFSDRGYVELP